MRLLKSEVNIIKTVILEYISDAKVVLFGSRVYDQKKGGDIDIFVETKFNITVKEQIKILSRIELLGILRKVDLVLKTPNSKEQSIFKTAMQEGIIL